MDVDDTTHISTDRLTPQCCTDWQLLTVKHWEIATHKENVEKTEEDEKHDKDDRETPQSIFNN